MTDQPPLKTHAELFIELNDLLSGHMILNGYINRGLSIFGRKQLKQALKLSSDMVQEYTELLDQLHRRQMKDAEEAQRIRILEEREAKAEAILNQEERKRQKKRRTMFDDPQER